jgi:hypothetical protein
MLAAAEVRAESLIRRVSATWSAEEQMAKRTTHRSTAGKKLYAVRDSAGRFKDIQTYERAHRADIKRGSAPEARKKR